MQALLPEQSRYDALAAELRDTAARLSRAQEELHWKSAFLEALTHSAIDGILVVDSQGRKILQNQRTADLFKIPRHIVEDPDDTRQVRWVMDMTRHPDQFREKVVHLYAHPSEISRDEIELTDGTVLDRYSSPVLGKDGAFYGRIWTFRDITELKQREAALRESEERVRAALRASHTGTFRWDIRSNEVVSDDAMHALFGLPAAQTVRTLETFLATVHPDDLAGVIERCRRCASDGADFDMEFRVLWPDGSLHWLDNKGRTSFDEAGKPACMTGTCVDITTHKLNEESLQKQQDELRALFDLMPAMIWFKDTQNGFIKVNQRVAEATGLSIDEIEGKTAEEVFPKEAAGHYVDDLEVIHSKAAKLGIIEKLRGPEGQELWVQTDKMPVCDKDGKVTGLIAMVHDITERRRTEDALRESEFRYHSLFENMLEGYAHCRIVNEGGQVRDFIYLEVNSAFEKLTGLKNVVGKPVSEIVPGFYETNMPLFEMYERVASTGEPERCETHLKSLGMWFSIAVYSHQKGHFVAVFDDITERKMAEEALRESEERFSGAFEHAPIGVALASPTGRWLKVNRALCKLVGYTEEELLTRSFQDITHPDDLPDSLECVRQLTTGESRVYQSEKRYIHAAGHLVTVLLNVSLVRDSQQQPRYFISQIQDITERKRTEESLRLLSSAVKQSKESIMITEADLDLPGPKIIFVNPAFTQMTGYTPAEVLGLTPRLLQGPSTDRSVLDRLRRSLEAGDTFAGEIINYRKDGTEFVLEWQVAPLRNARSEITHFVAIQRDITARKRLEAQLVQAQKMETVGKLAGGVAHEFNSILTAIIGQSELLLDDLPSASPLAGKVTAINQAAGRAVILTRQLLAYGRKQTLQPEMLSLNSVLAGMAGTVRHLAGPAIDIRNVPAPGLRLVKADAGQISQVIVNIVINACDAMPGGGRLTLETANVTFDQASVERHPDLKPGDYVMLAITDTGTGMSAAVQARVFEPFFSTKGVGEGTGLGLATCYGIIKQSGGHISVYSEPNVGTTFKIYLPQVAAASGPVPSRASVPGLPHGTETILLVEDDPALREMAGALLQRLGYTVLAAANGIEALGLQEAHLPGQIDLLITDFIMPQMNGRELAERVHATSPHTRTLFTSAFTANAISRQGVLNQGTALLQKPFTPAALAQKLREVLDQPRPA
jgi:two-component system cell cycle sensor histidine kinase/response regulator CckA